MKRFERHHDELAERLATGRPVESAEGLADFVEVLARSGDELYEPPAGFAAVLASEAAAANASHEKGSPTGRPLRSDWRRRAMVNTFISTLLGKFVLGGAAIAVATSGMAATGTLPPALQRTAAQTASQIGLHLPSPDGDAGAQDRLREQDQLRSHTESRSAEASGAHTATRSRITSGPADGTGAQTQTQTRVQDGTGTQTQTQTQTRVQDGTGTQTQPQTRVQGGSQTQTQTQPGGDSGPGGAPTAN